MSTIFIYFSVHAEWMRASWHVPCAAFRPCTAVVYCPHTVTTTASRSIPLLYLANISNLSTPQSDHRFINASNSF